MNLIKTFAAVVLVITFQGCSTGKVALDPVTTSTVADNDATALVEGCGQQPVVGFTYCRVKEGDTTEDLLTFVGPPAKCNRKDACAFLKIYDNQGSLAFGGPIPKGQTTLALKWKTLLSQNSPLQIVNNDGTLGGPSKPVIGDTFEFGQRGFWSFNLQVFFIGPDGRERSSQAQGDILLRVYKKSYTPLHAVNDDPAFVWEWNETYLGKKYDYKMTSALRAYVGPQ